MATGTTHTVDRRLALGGGLAAAAGLSWPRAQMLRRAVTQRGIFGGGVVAAEGGAAQFSLFASSLVFADGERDSDRIVTGRVLWVDETAGLTLESTTITDYENLHSAEGETRRIRGMMSAGDAGEQPFVMDVFAAGDPDAARDTITLAVGLEALVPGSTARLPAGAGEAATPAGAVGFGYAASGSVVSGDVQTDDTVVDFATGEVSVPAPAGPMT